MLREPACVHRARAAANESVPIARIGIHPVRCALFRHTGQDGCLCYKSWVQRWIGGMSVTAKILNDVPSSEKEKEEKKAGDKSGGMRALHSRDAKEESEANDCGHCLAETVSQGFAGEDYARRASFSRGKRRSRLTLTDRRRQATFAVFLFLDGD